MGQLARQERRYTRVRRQRDVYMDSNDQDEGDAALAEDTPPHLHHRLTNSISNIFNLAEFLQSSPGDPAFHVSTVLFRLSKHVRQMFSGLHPQVEGPPPEPTAGSGIRR